MMNMVMGLSAYHFGAPVWLIRDGSFVAVLLLLGGIAWFIYSAFRLAVSRLLVSYHWLRTCLVALLLMIVPAIGLYAWEFGVEGLLQQPGSAQAESEAGRHMLSVYFNSIYPGIPHLEPGIEALKGPHLLLLVAGIIGYLLISGVLLSLFVNVLQNKVKNIEQGDEPCVRLKGHIVLIGRGPLVVAYLRYLQKKEEEQRAQMSRWGRFFQRACKIVLLTEDSVPDVRERIRRDMDETVMQRLIFMHGSRNSKAELKGLWPEACREIVLLGDTTRPDGDDINIEALSILSDILSGKRAKDNPCPCTLYFERYDSYRLFLELYQRCYEDAQSADTNKQNNKDAPVLPGLWLEPMCPYKNWAHVVLQVTQPATEGTDGLRNGYRSPDYCPLTYHSDNTVHLVIIGMSRMGMGLAIEAANLLHFPNFARDKKLKTRITLIDSESVEMENWRLSAKSYFDAVDYRISCLGDDGVLHLKEVHHGWLDTQLHFIQAPVESEAVQTLLARFAEEKNTLLTIAVCLQNARRSLSVGLNLPAALYEKHRVIPEAGQAGVDCAPNILIRQDVCKGLLNLFSAKAKGKFANVRGFGMMDSELALAVRSDEDALVAAAMYMAYTSPGVPADEKEVVRHYRIYRDERWKGAPYWERVSNRYFAASLRTKIRSIRAREDVDDMRRAMAETVDADKGWNGAEVLARAEHYRWLTEKLLIGFTPLSPAERCRLDLETQQNKEQGKAMRSRLKAAMKHPDIAPYEQLPQSSKDYCAYATMNLYWLLPSMLAYCREQAARTK